MQKIQKKYIIKDEFSLEDCLFSLLPGDRVFFYGDLGAGKSTFIRHLLRKNLMNPTLNVRSPTYTYYEKYESDKFPSIYHFDLYRIDDYATFVSIGGEEILSDDKNILLIEWPELIEEYITPTKTITLELLSDENRVITIL